MARFPELAEKIQEAETPYQLWFALRDAFEQAYSAPRNESMIKRVYEYAFWCDQQPRGTTADDDLMTVVAVCFYEHLPEHPDARVDMPRWFTLQELLNMKSLLCYRISENDFRELEEMFHPHEKVQALKSVRHQKRH